MTRDLILIAVSLFTWGVGEGMFIFFQAIYLQQWGADPVAIGAILGASGIAMTVAQAPAGILADRIGRRPVMWLSWFLGGTAAWVMALANSLNVFIAGLLLYGLTSFVLAPMNSYVTGARGKWSVGRALTLVSASFSLGAVIGPTIGGIIGERLDLKTVYMIAACIFVVSTAIILFVKPQPVQRHSPAEQKTHLFQNRPFLGYMAVVFITILAIYLPQPLTPNFLQNERGLSLAAIGQLGSVSSLGSAVIMLALGHFHSGLAYLLGQFLVALAALLFWKGSGMGWYGLAYFALGGYRLCRSMSLAQVRALIRPAEMGLAYGIVETINSSAFILGPFLAGLIYDWRPEAIYPVTLALIGFSVIVSVRFVLRNRGALAPTAEVVELSRD